MAPKEGQRRISMRRCMNVAIVMILAAIAVSAQCTIIADSVEDFSDVQGYEGWYYGYYDGPFEPSDFHLMTHYIADASYGTSAPGAWVVDAASYWTAIWDEAQSPNGQDGLGRQPGEQWAVRRWISTVGGNLNISGRIAQLNNPPGQIPGGDGVTAHIVINDTEVWSQWVSGYDVAGINYSADISCLPGSTIDFILSPGANGVCDHFTYTATISVVPEPASFLALLCGIGGLSVLRRKR